MSDSKRPSISPVLSLSETEALFQQAKKYYIEEKYADALGICEKLAEQKYAPAQNILGMLYKLGRGVAKDEKKAVEYFELAAKQGNSIALYNLGSAYSAGRGVAKDEKKAVEYYELVAKQGYAIALQVYAVALLTLEWKYAKGKGVAKDEEKALEYFKLAVKNLELSQKSGLNTSIIINTARQAIEKGYNKAVEYFELATEHILLALKIELKEKRNLNESYGKPKPISSIKEIFNFFSLATIQKALSMLTPFEIAHLRSSDYDFRENQKLDKSHKAILSKQIDFINTAVNHPNRYIQSKEQANEFISFVTDRIMSAAPAELKREEKKWHDTLEAAASTASVKVEHKNTLQLLEGWVHQQAFLLSKSEESEKLFLESWAKITSLKNLSPQVLEPIREIINYLYSPVTHHSFQPTLSPSQCQLRALHFAYQTQEQDVGIKEFFSERILGDQPVTLDEKNLKAHLFFAVTKELMKKNDRGRKNGEAFGK